MQGIVNFRNRCFWICFNQTIVINYLEMISGRLQLVVFKVFANMRVAASSLCGERGDDYGGTVFRRSKFGSIVLALYEKII